MKILIVDDEPLIQIKIKNLLETSSLGIYTIFSTSDSGEALQILREQAPEILITDVRMPYITGIDLARFIYENKMDTLVIFITGYSDFQYAKSGIDYQIFDYLLKPIDDKNALDSIKKAVSLMLERNKHKEMYNLFQNYFSAHFSDARKQYIEKLLFSPITESKEELLEMQKQFSIVAEVYGLFGLTFSHKSSFWEEEFYYTHIIEEFLNKHFENGITYTFGNTIYVLCCLNQEVELKLYEYSTFHLLKKGIEQRYPVEVIIGISDTTKDFSKIQTLRKQVMECLEYLEAQKNQEIVFYFDLPFMLKQNEYFDVIDSIRELIHFMRLGKKSIIKVECEKLMKYLKELPFTYASDIIDLMISNILLFVKDISVSDANMEKIQNNILIPIRQQTDIVLKMEYFQYWIEFILDCMKETQLMEQNQLMKQVYEYININYKDAIGLTALSEFVNRNPSYLSRFIKQQTGKNFSQILTEKRIEEAKKLLKNTNLRISQIAEYTGYPNVKYFVRVFHSQVSMSPADYRKIMATFSV